MKLLRTSEGRLLNFLDAHASRRVALIGEGVATYLFPHQDVVGQWFILDGDYFRVVGVIENSVFTTMESRSVYIPYETFDNKYRTGGRFGTLLMASSQEGQSKVIQTSLTHWMARQYQFSSSDYKAFFFNNLEDQVKVFNTFFSGLRGFLWFMGLSTLMSGIIGVGNIMYVSAKERTHEIGIRKAVGAKRSAILWMFIWEAILLTSLAGYLGILTGMLILQGISYLMHRFTSDSLLGNPQIDVPITLAAMLILCLGGILAGFIPAQYAAKLDPVEALRHE